MEQTRLLEAAKILVQLHAELEPVELQCALCVAGVWVQLSKANAASASHHMLKVEKSVQSPVASVLELFVHVGVVVGLSAPVVVVVGLSWAVSAVAAQLGAVSAVVHSWYQPWAWLEPAGALIV